MNTMTSPFNLSEADIVADEDVVTPGNPAHVPIHQNPEALAALARGEDPFAEERALQEDIFTDLTRLNAITVEANGLRSKLLAMGNDLERIRGKSSNGGIKPENMGTLLRFIPVPNTP